MKRLLALLILAASSAVAQDFEMFHITWAGAVRFPDITGFPPSVLVIVQGASECSAVDVEIIYVDSLGAQRQTSMIVFNPYSADAFDVNFWIDAYDPLEAIATCSPSGRIAFYYPHRT